MERPISKPIGTPAEELDTPSLVVDLTVLERNIETMHSFFRDRRVKLRPSVTSHRSPAIAHRQLDAGGTVGGIQVATVGQAEVFAANGFADIMVANRAVTAAKIHRLCALARGAGVTVSVDNEPNVRDLSQAAAAVGVTLDVVVAVGVESVPGGVQPGRPAVELAQAVQRADGLGFVGFAAPEPDAPGDGHTARCQELVRQVVETRKMAEAAGLEVRVVSAGGTHNYETAGDMEGVTEVPAGVYALIDHRTRPHRKEFQPAARIMTSISSLPEEGLAITDGGAKSIGGDTGDPSVDNLPGVNLKGLSAEHVQFDLGPDLDQRLALGMRVWLTPWDVSECVNLHDYLHMVREGRLEAVWSVAARGHYR